MDFLSLLSGDSPSASPATLTPFLQMGSTHALVLVGFESLFRAYSNVFGQERILLIFVGFLLCSAVVSQIPLGSKLSVVENNHWSSSNGNFAIGFFNRSDQYSIGIHFNSNSISIGQQTVVWVAGADLTVGDKSYFQLTQNGELVLFDSTRGFVVWTSKTTNSSVASAVLLDSGNLILLNRKQDIVWQSFDTPTDTILPGQNLSISQSLRAASRNSMSSYYSLRMDTSGHLQLRWESHVVYWTSGNGIHSQSILRAILNSDGILQLLDQRSKLVWSVFGEDHNDSNVKLRFLRLDVDGNLRLYSWLDVLKLWRPVWQAVENQCKVFATCGLSGICVFNACRFHQQPILTQNVCHTFLYGIYPPNETIAQTSLQQCKSLCEKDPLCTSVTFVNDGTAQCQITKTQYITGQSDPSLSSISFVKKCSDPIAALPISPVHDTSPKQLNRLCIPCLIGVASCTIVVFFLFQLGIGFCIYKRRNYIRTKAALAYTGPNSNGLITLSYAEIKDLTGNFKHRIGPNIFEGMFPDNQLVAVKELKAGIEERMFRCIVSKIGTIYHKSLVKLEGYCCESNHRFLVYEFAKNGSLRQCIENRKACKRLTWRKRMEICVTVARAISYLHTQCREFVSHGNLKCENVVLDENFDAKVSEFGLAFDNGGAADEDVKDFGKMVVELVSGCREADNVCFWAYEKWVKGEAESIVDGRIEGMKDLEELERALRIAFWCLQIDGQTRPSIGEVIKVLEGTLTVDPPPPPFICRRPGEEEEELSESGPEL
ncbi:unnamed protein product [Camellia sinensis]